MNDKWNSYITPHTPRSGKVYGNIKTHKTDNPTRVITTRCNTALVHLSIFAQKVLDGIARELSPRIKNTNHMLDVIDPLNNSESVLVSYDILNMLPSIYNKM